MAAINYGGQCRQFFYDGGTGAIAYLLGQTDQNILLPTFQMMNALREV